VEMLTCLIVDDDMLGRELIAHYLDGIAHCDMAGDGLEALGKFKAALDSGRPYDLVMLDLLMPEMDGYETGKAIRLMESEQDLPAASKANIIVVSSVHTPQEIIQAYMSTHSVAHLNKPVKPEKLHKTLLQLELISA
jgi:two-component system, chemotaxis family, chemotaxis protein CheY